MKKVTQIIVGGAVFDIPGVELNIKYRVGASMFKGVRESVVREIITIDLAGLIYHGHQIIEDKKIPSDFQIEQIKQDIMKGPRLHTPEVQKVYLKETRKYWEERFSLDELVWLDDFAETYVNLEGRMGDEWLKLYSMVRGELPDDFPKFVSFSVMISNVLLRRSEKLKRKILKDYFNENENALSLLLSLRTPDNLPIDERIGLAIKDFVKYARAIDDERREKEIEGAKERRRKE